MGGTFSQEDPKKDLPLDSSPFSNFLRNFNSTSINKQMYSSVFPEILSEIASKLWDFHFGAQSTLSSTVFSTKCEFNEFVENVAKLNHKTLLPILSAPAHHGNPPPRPHVGSDDAPISISDASSYLECIFQVYQNLLNNARGNQTIQTEINDINPIAATKDNTEFSSAIISGFLSANPQPDEQDEQDDARTDNKSARLIRSAHSFSSWLDRNLPDSLYDLSRLLHAHLLHATPRNTSQQQSNWPESAPSPSSEAANQNDPQDNRRILAPSVAAILAGCLPPIYKKPVEHAHSSPNSAVNCATLELEKLSGWTNLFDSHRDGLSLSRVRETAIDYREPLVILISTNQPAIYCIASDEGFKEDFYPYGGADSRLFQLTPKFIKFVSGQKKPHSGGDLGGGGGAKSRSVAVGLGQQHNSQQQQSGAATKTFDIRGAGEAGAGIIYSHFSAKTSKCGLLVGHRPLLNAVLEIDESLLGARVTGHQCQLERMQVWATGGPASVARLAQQKQWDKAFVDRQRNRKLKVEDWADSPDRLLLEMGGVKANHAANLGVDPTVNEAKTGAVDQQTSSNN